MNHHNYRCSNCKTSGVKLWRQYNILACYVDLLCVDCACRQEKIDPNSVEEDGRRKIDYEQMTDQLVYLIPAVPTIEGDTFWGYTSVPEEGVLWWKNLPLRKE